MMIGERYSRIPYDVLRQRYEATNRALLAEELTSRLVKAVC
jgi:hypothetical protein